MIGEDIINMFASLGDIGMLLAIVVIIWIDGTAFPGTPSTYLALWCSTPTSVSPSFFASITPAA